MAILVFLLLAVFLPGCNQIDKWTIDTHYKRAEDYIGKRDYNKAIEEFEKIIKLDDKQIEAHMNLAFIYVRLGKGAMAEKKFLKVLSLDRHKSKAIIGLAMSCKIQGKLDEARKELESFLEIKPEDIEVLCQTGFIYLEIKDMKEAENKFNKVLKNTSEGEIAAMAHFGLGKVFMEKGKGEKDSVKKKKLQENALCEFDSAARLDSSFVETYYNEALIYMDMKKYEDAIEKFQKVLETAKGKYKNDEQKINFLPDSSFYTGDVYLNLGKIYYYRKDYLSAIRELKVLNSLYPNDMNAWELLASSYMAIGDGNGAVLYYKKLLSSNPRNAEMHYNLAEAYLKSKNYEASANELEIAYDFAVSQGNVELQEKIESYVEDLAN